jgi:hypothetical protein
MDEALAAARFLVPLALMTTLSGVHALAGLPRAPLRLLDQNEFLAAIGGLLTNRLSLFYSEVVSQLTRADWLGVLPGSFAEGFRQQETIQNALGVKQPLGRETEVSPSRG